MFLQGKRIHTVAKAGKYLLAVLLTVCTVLTLLCSSGFTFAEEKITEDDILEMQGKIKDLEVALEKQKALLSEKQHNEETLQLALGTYTALAKQYFEQIEENEKAQGVCLAALEEYKQKEQELEERRKELHGNYLLTLRQLREDRNISPLEMVFDAESLDEFLFAFERARDLAEYKSALLEKMETEFGKLEQESEEISKKLAEQVAIGEELKAIKQGIEDQISETEAHLTEIAQDILAAKSSIMEYEDISRETLSELSELIKAYERQLEEERIRREEELRRQEEEKRRQEEEAERQRLARQSLLWPLDYPLNKRCTSPYGYRLHPISKTYKFHSGVDLAGPHSGDIMNNPIYASMDGTVITCVVDRGTTGYGTYVIISHGYNERYGGYISTLYAHCDKLYVEYNEHVTQGQIIGEVGSTGSSTGPHLHYEVRMGGETTDPFSYTYITELGGTPVDPKTFLTGDY